MEMKKISVIVPMYYEQEVVKECYKRIKKVLIGLENEYEHEIIFVNDGSKDKTLNILKDIAVEDKLVKIISFSRNFGKESAMLAGLDYATGDYVTLMDADLQDPPKLLPDMLKIIEEEQYDCVGTRRVTRKGEPPIRSFFARLFYKIINKMSKIEMVDGARDYRLMTRQMVNSILECREYNRYSKGLWSFVGYKTKWIEFENVNRIAGETKWSFWKLFKYAIEGIVAFTTLPLTIAAFLGICLCVIAFVFIIIIIVKTLIWGDPVEGWPSLACIIIFASGIQLFFMEILGEYLSKTYLETKKRPIYIVKETEKDL